MLALSSALAQENASQGGAVMRVETRLVEISVVAQDSRGRAVTGLSRNDFQLYDDGKPVPIEIFSAPSPERAPAETLPPNTFSNQIVAQPNITVVLLDGLNTSFHDQSWARTEVVRFLSDLRPEDRVGIMFLGDHLSVLQNFTSDPELLLAALKHAPLRNPRELEGSAPPQSWDEADQASLNVMGNGASGSINPSIIPTVSTSSASGTGSASSATSMGLQGEASAMAQMEAVMSQFQGHESAYFQVDSVQRTLDALLAIAKYLGHFPGRKNLIWVSGGFPISIGFDAPRAPGDTRDQIHFTAALEQAYKALNAALNNANMSIYPVDARGLVAGAPGMMDWNKFYSTQSAMKELASATGGRAFLNTNDLARVIRAAADDSKASYELGFYAHDVRQNGKYHSLKVKVSRPGVHLRYRPGYFADWRAVKTPKTDDPVAAQFDQAIYSPLDSPGVGLTVTLDKVVHLTSTRRNMRTNQLVPWHKTRALLGIDVDARELALKSGSGGDGVQLTFVVAQTGADGKVLDANRYDMKMRIAARSVERLRDEGLHMQKWVDLTNGATSLELVVRDANSGALGSVRIPIGGA